MQNFHLYILVYHVSMLQTYVTPSLDQKLLNRKIDKMELLNDKYARNFTISSICTWYLVLCQMYMRENTTCKAPDIIGCIYIYCFLRLKLQLVKHKVKLYLKNSILNFILVFFKICYLWGLRLVLGECFRFLWLDWGRKTVGQ